MIGNAIRSPGVEIDPCVLVVLLQCAGVLSVLNTYYGRSDLPIGAYKGDGLAPDASYLPYVDDLTANWPAPIQNASQVPDAVAVYRAALAGAADRSVAISSIGLLTNLAALLASPADEVSALTGAELVARKVRPRDARRSGTDRINRLLVPPR